MSQVGLFYKMELFFQRVLNVRGADQSKGSKAAMRYFNIKKCYEMYFLFISDGDSTGTKVVEFDLGLVIITINCVNDLCPPSCQISLNCVHYCNIVWGKCNYEPVNYGQMLNEIRITG